MKLRQILYFVVPCFIWGSTWFAIKFQLGQVDPLVSVSYRFLIAGLLLMVFSLFRKLNLRFTFREHLLMILQGIILFGFNYWLVYLAETNLASGIVAIIFSFSIFTNIFFNYLLLKGKIRREVMAGAVLGIAGTFLIFNHELKNSEQMAIGYQALLFCFGSIVLASLGNILSKYNQTRKLPVIQTNAFGMTYGSLAMMLMVPLSGRSFSFDVSFPYIASLFYLAIFGSIVAFTLYLKLVGDIGPDRAGYTTLVAPVIALIISSFFENYQWGIVAVFGVILLFAGNILALKMKTYINPQRMRWDEMLKRPLFSVADLRDQVQTILTEIQTSGIHALRKYTEKFDGVFISNLAVSPEEVAEACNLVDTNLKDAITIAAANIQKFHESQVPQTKRIETTSGVTCWQKAVAIDKVGLYVPGGSAPLFSTVLMLAIPAKIAGCKEIVLCTPPDKDGKINPAILFAAQLVGVTKIFKLGGVQAIGAMAYGIDCVPKVNKIFGPGNQYVMAAKQLVSISDVAIDMPAGPSEVAVMADSTANPAFIAADLLSQAEHGPDSQVVLVTNDHSLIEKVVQELTSQLNKLPRQSIAEKALANSQVVVLDRVEDMIDLINGYAPEHLIIAMGNYAEVADKITNAGSVFLGNYTPESAGDYASGTNHTLPTNGWARSFSGVNLDSYIKKITFQEITPEGIQKLGPVIETMAAAELLDAHKNAVTLRLNELQNK